MEERPCRKIVHANDANGEERKQSVNTRDWLAPTRLDRSDRNRTAKVGDGVEAGSGRLRASFFSPSLLLSLSPSLSPVSLSFSPRARSRPVLVSPRPSLPPSSYLPFARSLAHSLARPALFVPRRSTL